MEKLEIPLEKYIKILKCNGRHIFKSATFIRVTFLNMNFIASNLVI